MSSAHCSLIVWSALDAAIVLVLVPLSLVVAPTPPVCPDDKPQLCAQAYNALAVALVGLRSEDFFSTTHSVNVTLFERALRTAIPSIKEVHILNAYDEALPVPTCWRTGPHLQHEHSSAPDCGSPSLLIPPAVTLLSNPLRDSPNNSVVVAATVVVFAVSDGNRNRNRNAAAAPLYGVMRRPELHTRLLANLAAFRGAFASANMSGQSVVFPVDQCALEQSSGPRGPASDRYTELDLSPLWTSPWYRRPEQHVGPMLDLRLRCALGCRQRVFNADGRCRYDTCSGRGKCSEERGIGGIKRAVCTDCSPASGARCQATKRHLDGSQYGLFEPLQRCGESGEEVTAVSLETMTASASLGGAQLLFYAGPLSTESSEAAAPSSLANTSVMVALLLVPEIISQSYKPVLAVGPVSDPAVLFFRELEGSRLLDPAWHRIEVEISATKALIRVDRCFASSQRRQCEKELNINASNLPKGALNALALYPLQVGGLFKGGAQVRYPNVRVGQYNYDLNTNLSGFKGCINNVRVNSELLDWGPEVQPVGACPFEGFQNEPYEYTCNESELNSMCVGTRNGENDQHAGIYPMRICRRGFHGPPCDKPSATAKVGGDSKIDWLSLERPYPWAGTSKYIQLQLSFLTDQPNCCLFSAGEPEQNLMFALRLIGGELRLEIRSKAVLVFVNVPGRNVSDGLFHHVVVTRFMHLMELLLDDGEGVNYVSKTQLEAENLGLKFARDKFSTQRCPTAPSAVLQVPPASKAQSHIPIPTGRLEQQFGLSDESNYVLLQDIRLLDNWRKAESELVQWLPLSDKEVAENKNYKNRSAMPPTALVNQSWAPCSAPSSACGPTQNCKSGLKSTVCHCDPCQNVSELPLSNSSYPSAVWACARLGENPCAQSSTCPSPDTKCVVRPLQPSFVNGTLPNSCDFLGPNIPISTKQPGEFPVVLVASAGGLLLLILLLALLFVILYICWRRRRLRQQKEQAAWVDADAPSEEPRERVDVGGGSSVTDEKQRPVGGGEAGAIDQLDYDEDLLRTAIAELRAGKLHFAHSSAGGNGLDAGDDSATQVAIANGYRGVAPNQPFASAAAGDGAVGYDPNGQYLGAADPNNEFSATGGFSDPSFIFTPYGGYEMQNLQSVSGDRTVPVGPVTDYNGYGYGAQVNRAFYADSMELTADQSAVPPPFNPQSQVAAPSAVQQLQLQLQYESDVKLYEYLSNRLYMQHVNEVGVHYPVDSVRSFAAESATSGSVFRVRSPEPNPEGAMATGRRVNGNALPPDVLSNIVSVDESETTIELDVMPLATSQNAAASGLANQPTAKPAEPTSSTARVSPLPVVGSPRGPQITRPLSPRPPREAQATSAPAQSPSSNTRESSSMLSTISSGHIVTAVPVVIGARTAPVSVTSAMSSTVTPITTTSAQK